MVSTEVAEPLLGATVTGEKLHVVWTGKPEHASDTEPPKFACAVTATV